MLIAARQVCRLEHDQLRGGCMSDNLGRQDTSGAKAIVVRPHHTASGTKPADAKDGDACVSMGYGDTCTLSCRAPAGCTKVCRSVLSKHVSGKRVSELSA